MVQALERIITVAEIAARGARAAKALRQLNQGEAAAVLEKECTDQCKRIVQGARRRRQAAARARQQTRSGGRFV